MDRRTLLKQGLRAGIGIAAAGLHTKAMRAEGLAPMHPGSPDEATSAISGRGSLKAHASARGLLTGCAVDISALRSDLGYRSLIAQQYNVVVAENAMKFNAMEPKPGEYNFHDADELVGFAQEHGMKVRGHNFMWHEALPDWFAGTVTQENARKILTDHIMAVGGRYKGRIHSWDVVNEAIWPRDGRPDGLRSSSPWFETIGPDFVDFAFRTARKADPSAILTYNDYGIEYDTAEESAKRAAVLAMLRRMKAAGVPVDALGVQSHIHAGSSEAYAKGIAELQDGARDLGLKLFITEMDVKDDGLAEESAALRDASVARTYSEYLTQMLGSRAVGAVLTWGVSDRRTWLNHGKKFRPDHPDREQRPLPFDSDLKPKAAFFAIRNAFDGAPRR